MNTPAPERDAEAERQVLDTFLKARTLLTRVESMLHGALARVPRCDPGKEQLTRVAASIAQVRQLRLDLTDVCDYGVSVYPLPQ